MPLERRALQSALTRKGFVEEIAASHDKYWLYDQGVKQPVFTFVSRGTGSREIHDGLVSTMAKQLKLTSGQLRQLVDCSIDGPGYLGLLRAQGISLSGPAAAPGPPSKPTRKQPRRKRRGR